MKNVNKKGSFLIKSKNSGQKIRGKPFRNDKMKKSFTFKTNQQKNIKLQKFEETSSGDFFIQKNKPSTSSSDQSQQTSSQKRPFDKKLWRLQKYSKKYKLEQFEEKRKKHVLKEYYRQISDDKPKFDVKKIYEEEQSDNDEVNDNENNLNSDINQSNRGEQEVETMPLPNSSGNKRKWAFKKAQDEFERIKGEKQQKRKEIQQKKAERDEALKEYKKKKTEKFKKLSKRTKKGQPIMKDRMEMLLEEIQNSLNS